MQIDNYFKAKSNYAEFLQVITVKQSIDNKCYNCIYMLNKGVVVMEYKLLVEEDLSKCTETFIEVFNDETLLNVSLSTHAKATNVIPSTFRGFPNRTLFFREISIRMH